MNSTSGERHWNSLNTRGKLLDEEWQNIGNMRRIYKVEGSQKACLTLRQNVLTESTYKICMLRNSEAA